MCGIAGILRVFPLGAEAPGHFESIPESWLDLLDASIKHRGPDGHGRFRDRVIREDGCVLDVALVHRRLSIIDHADGAQPMISFGAPTSGTPPHHVRAAYEHEASAQNSAQNESVGWGDTGTDTCATSFGSHSVRGSEASVHASALPMLFHASPQEPGSYREIAPEAPAARGLLAVVFNGCIYNHRSLRAELQAAGHRFLTDHADTEVLLHGWRAWRETLFARADGMYALALWDRDAGELVLARDGFGEKPLYSWHSKELQTLAFGSSVPGLLALARRASGTSTRALPSVSPEYLSGWIKFGWNQVTPFAGVGERLPGFFGVHGDDVSTQACLTEVVPPEDGYEMPCARVGHPQEQRLDADTLDAALDRAVHSRIEADVPIACFLSGGIDSALVCHYARRHRPEIRAFTVRMPHPDFDESDAAATTARALGIRHDILECHPRPAEDLVAIIEQLGLPFGDSSLLPSLWVSRAARRHVTVALSGDGGDELFLGYDRHRALDAFHLMSLVPQPVLAFLASIVPSGTNVKSWRNRVARLLAAGANEGYKEILAIFEPPLDRRLGLLGGLTHFGLTKVGREEDGAFRTLVARRFDLCFYLPHDLLRKSDTSSMSCALEVRAPFLSHEVAALAIDASRESLMPKGQRKGLLRAVARRHLPAEIVERPKMGFAIPIGEWFRTDYGGMKSLLFDALQSADAFPADLLGFEIEWAFVGRLLDEHMSMKRDHSQRLYMLLVLAIWCRWVRKL